MQQAVYSYIHIWCAYVWCEHTCIFIHPSMYVPSYVWYGVATISRRLKMIGLFCRISSLLQGSFAKETYHFIDPTNRSHPILRARIFVVHLFGVNNMYVHTFIYVYIGRAHIVGVLIFGVNNMYLHTLYSVCIYVHIHIQTCIYV